MIGGISIWQLLIILAIIVLIFGTKRMRNLGSDLGNALRGFRKAVKDEPTDAEFSEVDEQPGIEHQPSDMPLEGKTKTAATSGKAPARKPQAKAAARASTARAKPAAGTRAKSGAKAKSAAKSTAKTTTRKPAAKPTKK